MVNTYNQFFIILFKEYLLYNNVICKMASWTRNIENKIIEKKYDAYRKAQIYEHLRYTTTRTLKQWQYGQAIITIMGACVPVIEIFHSSRIAILIDVILSILIALIGVTISIWNLVDECHAFQSASIRYEAINNDIGMQLSYPRDKRQSAYEYLQACQVNINSANASAPNISPSADNYYAKKFRERTVFNDYICEDYDYDDDNDDIIYSEDGTSESSDIENGSSESSDMGNDILHTIISGEEIEDFELKKQTEQELKSKSFDFALFNPSIKKLSMNDPPTFTKKYVKPCNENKLLKHHNILSDVSKHLNNIEKLTASDDINIPVNNNGANNSTNNNPKNNSRSKKKRNRKKKRKNKSKKLN